MTPTRGRVPPAAFEAKVEDFEIGQRVAPCDAGSGPLPVIALLCIGASA